VPKLPSQRPSPCTLDSEVGTNIPKCHPPIRIIPDRARRKRGKRHRAQENKVRTLFIQSTYPFSFIARSGTRSWTSSLIPPKPALPLPAPRAWPRLATSAWLPSTLRGVTLRTACYIHHIVPFTFVFACFLMCNRLTKLVHYLDISLVFRPNPIATLRRHFGIDFRIDFRDLNLPGALDPIRVAMPGSIQSP